MPSKDSLRTQSSLWELATNWLAILVLLSVGVVWPPV